MSDGWRPSNYKPRGGWRAMLPGWRALLVMLGGAGVIAAKVIVLDGWDSDASFTAMKIVAAILFAACVAPHLLGDRPAPRPGHFPTGHDGDPRAGDDPETR